MYRTWIDNETDILFGYCKYINGELISEDGDIYSLDDEIEAYEYCEDIDELVVWYSATFSESDNEKIYRHNYYIDHREDILKRVHNYYIKNIDKRKEASKRRYNEHKKEYKQYYIDHLEEKIAYQKQYNLNHVEERKAYQRQYYRDHIKEIKAYRKQYYNEHKKGKENDYSG